MPVSEQAWMQGMAELGACFPARDEELEETALRAQAYRRELQPYLIDHQWRHAVSETIRTERWFPQASVLLDLAMAAPPPPSAGLLAAARCAMCDDTGFELEERDGRTWAAPCSRCRPRVDGRGV